MEDPVLEELIDSLPASNVESPAVHNLGESQRSLKPISEYHFEIETTDSFCRSKIINAQRNPFSKISNLDHQREPSETSGQTTSRTGANLILYLCHAFSNTKRLSSS